MNTNGFDALASTLHRTYEWIAAIAEDAHLERNDAFKALRAVLQTLRDRLPVDDAAHFAAQLPMLVRGLFYEGWRPSKVPIKMHRNEFLAAVGERMITDRAINPFVITQHVLGVLSRLLSPGEVGKLRDVLPRDIRELWPEPAAPVPA
jgi:uncharacterized protein (DUF2267 family)